MLSRKRQTLLQPRTESYVVFTLCLTSSHETATSGWSFTDTDCTAATGCCDVLPKIRNPWEVGLLYQKGKTWCLHEEKEMQRRCNATHEADDIAAKLQLKLLSLSLTVALSCRPIPAFSFSTFLFPCSLFILFFAIILTSIVKKTNSRWLRADDCWGLWMLQSVEKYA